MGSGAGLRRMAGGDERVGAGRPGTLGWVVAVRQVPSPAVRRTQRRLCRQAPHERREGQHEQHEAQQKWQGVQCERDDGHLGPGCRDYTISVH